MQSTRHDNLNAIIYEHSYYPHIPHFSATLALLLNENYFLYFREGSRYFPYAMPDQLMLLDIKQRIHRRLDHAQAFSFHQVASDRLITVSQNQLKIWNLTDFTLINNIESENLQMGYAHAHSRHHYNISLKQHHIAVKFCPKRNCLIGFGRILAAEKTNMVLWFFDIATSTLYHHELPDTVSPQTNCTIEILKNNEIAVFAHQQFQLIICELYRANQSWYCEVMQIIALPRDELFPDLPNHSDIEKFYLSADRGCLGTLYRTQQKQSILKFWQWHGDQFEQVFARVTPDLKASPGILPTEEVVFMDDTSISTYHLKEHRETLLRARTASDLDFNIGLNHSLVVLQHDQANYHAEVSAIPSWIKINKKRTVEWLDQSLVSRAIDIPKDILSIAVDYHGPMSFFAGKSRADNLKHKTVASVEAQINFYETLATPNARPASHKKTLLALHNLKNALLPLCMDAVTVIQTQQIHELIDKTSRCLEAASHIKNTHLTKHLKILTLFKKATRLQEGPRQRGLRPSTSS